MNSPRASLLVTAVVACAAGALLFAHVRLVNPSNANPLHWSVPSAISIVINATGSDNINDQGHVPAIRNAFRAWNKASGSSARLLEDTTPAQRARSDWESDSVHLVWFDETNESGYFPIGSGTVAITPVWFTSGGVITDADVLFNGASYQFTTSGVPGRFDVQDVLTHELGHLFGLDHSGWAGASMYPYVDTAVILHRSLSQDDVHGMRDCYPSATFATLTGTLERGNSSPVSGAHVVAVDDQGRPAASTLTASNGTWRIAGLDAGNYTLYATPLDEPVSSANLGAGHTVQIDFSTSALGSVNILAGQATAFGTAVVDPDATLVLGRVMDDFPKRVVRGTTTTLTLHGSGLAAGSSLACSDPDVLVNVLSWNSSSVNFQVDVSAGEPVGNLDLTVTNLAGLRHTLVGGLEVTPADPDPASIVPASATDAGGTLITLHGSEFRAGQMVVIGPNIYADGEAGGCHVVDANTIQLRSRATTFGTYDVVVIDPTGVEGRLLHAMTFAHVPEIQSLFPVAGFAGGGTRVTLRGQNFEAGVQVRIDGVTQTQLELSGDTELSVTTEGGVVGGPYLLEVEIPGGATATSAFSYSVLPDPSLLAIDPPSGTALGGTIIVLHGANFPSSASVLFGADESTGTGGTPAKSVTYIDDSTLEVVTPSHASGAHSVIVLDDGTGQALVASAAFTFTSSDSGGGGGGCYTVPLQPPAGWRQVLAGSLGWIVLAAIALARRRRTQSEPSPVIAG